MIEGVTSSKQVKRFNQDFRYGPFAVLVSSPFIDPSKSSAQAVFRSRTILPREGLKWVDPPHPCGCSFLIVRVVRTSSRSTDHSSSSDPYPALVLSGYLNGIRADPPYFDDVRELARSNVNWHMLLLLVVNVAKGLRSRSWSRRCVRVSRVGSVIACSSSFIRIPRAV